MLKTEQIVPQQILSFPDFPGQNTARTKINYKMPEVDKDSGGRDCCGGLDYGQQIYASGYVSSHKKAHLLALPQKLMLCKQKSLFFIPKKIA